MSGNYFKLCIMVKMMYVVHASPEMSECVCAIMY